MLTYDSRLLRAARASSGEPIETNAKPLFLVLLYIESLATATNQDNPDQKNNQKQKPFYRKITTREQLKFSKIK